MSNDDERNYFLKRNFRAHQFLVMRNSSAIVFFIAGVVFIIFVNEASLEIKSVAHICGREFYDVLPRGDIVMINVDIKKMHQKIKEGRQTSR